MTILAPILTREHAHDDDEAQGRRLAIRGVAVTFLTGSLPTSATRVNTTYGADVTTELSYPKPHSEFV